MKTLAKLGAVRGNHILSEIIRSLPSCKECGFVYKSVPTWGARKRNVTLCRACHDTPKYRRLRYSSHVMETRIEKWTKQ